MKTKISRIEQKQRILFSGRCGKLWASCPAGPEKNMETSPLAEPAADSPLRPDFQLSDNLWAERGQVFLTGTQALVRLLLMQRSRDAARGLDTRGFVSGYRGSPLGMLDQAIWKVGTKFSEHGVRFVPAVNEELGATQVLGTQRVESDPERTVDGVYAMWYGKGPGVDRAGDAIKHGNAYGASPHGGVLVVAGDDHGCVSSSMPHQSDQLLQAFTCPSFRPATWPSTWSSACMAGRCRATAATGSA
jgi:indolepyruvate ferredoxin oxidoreductase